MTKCVVYARVSTAEQRDEGYSLAAQLKALEEYCVRQGFEIAATFVESESARTTGRTEFGKMLAFFRQHPDVRTVVVHKYDRLTRNFEDPAKLDKIGVAIRCVVGDFPDSVQGILLRDIYTALAKNYTLNLSYEVAKGQSEKAQQGGWLTRAPAGYLNDKATRTIVVDPAVAPLIRLAFERYASGLVSLLDLAAELEEKGLRTRGGNKVHRSTLHKLLKNPVYCGMVTYHGQIYPGAHEPLISLALFEKAQEAFLPNRTNNAGVKRSFILRDFLYCAECGCKITAGQVKGYTYYRCTHGKDRKDHESCSQHRYAREELLVEQVHSLLKRIAIPANVVEALVEEARLADELRYGCAKSERDAIARALNVNKKRRSALVDSMLDGVIDEETYRTKDSELSKAGATLELRQRELDSSVSATFPQVERLAEIGAGAGFTFGSGSEQQKRELLATVLCNLTLEEGNIASYQYKRPFDALERDPEGAFICSWSG